MPKRQDIQKIMVIGSGPIVIGQAAEFDYSGTQACKALKEEGYEVILVNSNPATIMTDLNMADRIYVEPLEEQVIIRILEHERPQGLLATLGGQTGLNMALKLAEDGVLAQLNIDLLGATLYSIQRGEDRELFKELMREIGERVPNSTIVHSLAEAVGFAAGVGYPLIVRPAYTLGGTGGGTARNLSELRDIVGKGLKNSIIHQVLLEQSVAGWKEIEYEVVRDGADNCVAVCNMENIDPVGIHTGDSIVVAPCQTLSRSELTMLHDASFKIIRALRITGGCNIQFALNPLTNDYVVIEVNPRLSRSSALASKATGYPIARVASKIAIGMTLPEIANSVTNTTSACFEPAIDYVVVKVPRWPFDKFVTANRTLGTQMKATGEVMAIGRTFEEALLKAIDSLDVKLNYQIGMSAIARWSDEQIYESLLKPDDERIFVVSEALARGWLIEKLYELTRIDKFFIQKLLHIVELGNEARDEAHALLPATLQKLKQYGFGDAYIAQLAGLSESAVYRMRRDYGIQPTYKMVDTCAGEYEAATPYYYSCFEQTSDDAPDEHAKVVVLGSGPIRIGQGIEFDYCSVHSAMELRRRGVTSIIINSNPETVSTDFDTSDKLYFEPLTQECVLDIVRREQPLGVVVQFGGQTAINLAASLEAAGFPVLGTSVADIDCAEDRERFLQLLRSLDIPLPSGGTAFTVAGALDIAHAHGYPVIVRPSYVLGGRAMEIVYNDDELREYMQTAVDLGGKHPVLVDKYITGKEIEIDGIGDGEHILLPGIMEHIERAGVHSGDSIAVYPPHTLTREQQDTIVDYAMRIGRALRIRGLYNIQFAMDAQGKVYVLEVNPRASRTVPILSKVTRVPMVSIATRIMLGETLAQCGYGDGLLPPTEYTTVKAPVFSFSKMTTVDTFLGPEMKSTGEVMGTAPDMRHALRKALLASGLRTPEGGTVLLSLTPRDFEEGLTLARRIASLGLALSATPRTAGFLADHGVAVTQLTREEALEALKGDGVALAINTPTRGKQAERYGFRFRRTAMEYAVPCITSLDTANAAFSVAGIAAADLPILALHQYR